MFKRRKNLYRRKRSRIRRTNKKLNPFKVERGKIWAKFFLVLNIVLLASIIYFVYFFFISDYYNIKNINVNGINYVSTDDFMELVDNHVDSFKFAFIDSENIFLYNRSSLRKRIDDQYLFADLTIKKVLPDTLNIDVTEKNVIYRLKSQSNEYLVDDHGLVVKKITNFNNRPSLLTVTESIKEDEAKKEIVSLDESDIFTVLYFEENISLNIAQDILRDEDVEFISKIIKESSNSTFNLRLISIPTVFPEHLQILTQEGWKIFFNLNDSFDKQMETLKLVINQQIGIENLPRLDYIDLRLGKNVYFKYKY